MNHSHPVYRVARVLIAAVFVLPRSVYPDAGLPNAPYRHADGVTPSEIARLPKYCYAQYVDERLVGNPEYSILECGAGMNHFCPGLVYLQRAQNVRMSRSDRRNAVRPGMENVQYTIVRMTQGCSIRAEVESAMQKFKMLERMLK